MDCDRRAGAPVGILGDPVPRLSRAEVEQRASACETEELEAQLADDLVTAGRAKRMGDHYRSRLANWGQRPGRGTR